MQLFHLWSRDVHPVQMCCCGQNFKKIQQFLSRVSILTRDIDIALLSVRLSIRHIPVFYRNDLTYCYSFFTAR